MNSYWEKIKRKQNQNEDLKKFCAQLEGLKINPNLVTQTHEEQLAHAKAIWENSEEYKKLLSDMLKD